MSETKTKDNHNQELMKIYGQSSNGNYRVIKKAPIKKESSLVIECLIDPDELPAYLMKVSEMEHFKKNKYAGFTFEFDFKKK